LDQRIAVQRRLRKLYRSIPSITNSQVGKFLRGRAMECALQVGLEGKGGDGWYAKGKLTSTVTWGYDPLVVVLACTIHGL